MDQQTEQMNGAEEPWSAALQQRIIETADEYHYIAEDQWSRVADLDPTNDELVFEFRRLIRAALVFYIRAYLELDLIETDGEQQLEDLYEIVCEQQPELAEFFEQNNMLDVLGEESHANLSQLFSVAEAMRTVLLDRSNQLAATLGTRFADQ
ncbi:MAG: hypothetical protein JST22_13370 [Bacteroidetes bacterium]|nr:hypothetical protein [Bacteroidota bacterium]